MPGPRFEVDLKETKYKYFSAVSEEKILELLNAAVKTRLNKGEALGSREVKKEQAQKLFLEAKKASGVELTQEEKKLDKENTVNTKQYKSWKFALNKVNKDLAERSKNVQEKKNLENQWEVVEKEDDANKNPNEKDQINAKVDKKEDKKQKTGWKQTLKNFVHKGDFLHLFHKKHAKEMKSVVELEEEIKMDEPVNIFENNELNNANKIPKQKTENQANKNEVNQNGEIKNENKNNENINENEANKDKDLKSQDASVAQKNNQKKEEQPKEGEDKTEVLDDKKVGANKSEIEESNVNVNRTAEQIKEKAVLEEGNNQKANVEDNKKEAEKNDTQVKEKTAPVNQEKLDASLLAFGDQLNNTAAENQAVLSNMLLKNSPEASEADKQVLAESHKALAEKEADVRKYMPVKTDELNISVPKLIQDQMRLEAGQMTRDEKNQHFMNIIEMKGMDGDKYDKQLRDYGMKVAEEAGREFEKKHQDPAKLSFLNKSANAIETVMCAMSRNPLGILMLLAAAMYAPLMMVGLLAFTAWKRKRPNPAYQNAWQEQNRRELEQKREQLANLYNVDASSISDREVTKALKADYVNAKIIDAMDAKLERDSRKAVDSIAKDYAKSISKESGTKYSAKDLKDSAKKDLLWKDRYEENAATLLTNREDKMRKAIEHHENEKKKAMGRSL